MHSGCYKSLPHFKYTHMRAWKSYEWSTSVRYRLSPALMQHTQAHRDLHALLFKIQHLMSYVQAHAFLRIPTKSIQSNEHTKLDQPILQTGPQMLEHTANKNKTMTTEGGLLPPQKTATHISRKGCFFNPMHPNTLRTCTHTPIIHPLLPHPSPESAC